MARSASRGQAGAVDGARASSTRVLLRFAVALVVVGSLTAGTVSVSASPQDDKRRVTSQLGSAHADLDDSSAALIAATNALTAAQAKLSAAQSELARVQGLVASAKAQDIAATAAATAADAAKKAADAAVVKAQGEVDRQRAEIGQFANATYQNSNIDGLSVVVGSQSTDDLLSAMQIISSVADTQTAALTEYTELRGRLAVKLAAARAAAVTASDLRAKAAVKLANTRALERQAAAAATAVRGLVTDRAAAQHTAAQARAADLARIGRLEAERARIETVLKKIAAKRAAQARARAVAAAKAAAKAKREAAAAARARAANAAAAAARAARTAAASRAATASANGSSSNSNDSGALFRHPADGPITSPFGMRFHPILHVWKLHDGTDFGVACGTPLYAARAGTVVSTYFNVGYGNRVIIEHGWLDGADMATSYNHMTRWIVHPGEHVAGGQLIGYSGTTGYSTGCHLHFMVYRNGVAVNPINYL